MIKLKFFFIDYNLELRIKNEWHQCTLFYGFIIHAKSP
jgi:hypothetical protein